MPTLVATPWPSGPVVVSTPEVQPYSGWPGQRLPAWRNVLMSSSVTASRPSFFIGRVDRLDAGQMDQAVQQHRGMAAGQHEPVAIDPAGIRRIVAQHTLPQRVGRRRGVHRRAGMAGLRLLHRVHHQHPDGVDRELIQIRMTCHSSTSHFREGRIVAVPAFSFRPSASGPIHIVPPQAARRASSQH